MKKWIKTAILMPLFLLLALSSCEGEDSDSAAGNHKDDSPSPKIVQLVPASGSAEIPCAAQIIIVTDTRLDSAKAGSVSLDSMVFKKNENCDILISDKQIVVKPYAAFTAGTSFKGIRVSGFFTETDEKLPEYSEKEYCFTTSAEIVESSPEGAGEEDRPAEQKAAKIVINEFCTENKEGAENEFIEIFNAGGGTELLDAEKQDGDYALYKFSNSADSRSKWELIYSFSGTSLSVEAGGYLSIAAGSYLSNPVYAYQPSLSSKCGGIVLVKGSRSEGEIVDVVCYNTDGSWNNAAFCQWSVNGSTSENKSFIRNPDGTDSDTAADWSLSPGPTPGAKNNAGIIFVLDPMISESTLKDPGSFTLQAAANCDSMLYFAAVKTGAEPTAEQILNGHKSNETGAEYAGNCALSANQTAMFVCENIAAGMYSVYAVAYIGNSDLHTFVVHAGDVTVQPAEGALFSCKYTFEGEIPLPESVTGIDSASQAAFVKGTEKFPRGWDSTDAFSTNNWRDQDENYLEITLGAPGKTIRVKNISFDNLASASGPSAYTITASHDAHAASIAAGIPQKSGDSAFASASHSVEIEAADQIVIRIHAHGAASSSGTWRIDNLSFEGVVE